MKAGRFTLQEIKYIEENVLTLNYHEIGRGLNRNPTSVYNFITKKMEMKPIEPSVSNSLENQSGGIRESPDSAILVHRPEPAERAIVTKDLRNTEAWQRLLEEFTKKELKYFEERYVEMVTQFKEVVSTEVTQIFQSIKFEILMSRNLASRKKALESIEFLEQAQARQLEDFCPDGDRTRMSEAGYSRIMEIETQIGAARSDEQSKTAEYAKLQERHEKLMQAMKATRDQRLDKIESGKINFLDIIRQLSQRDVQMLEGRQMELMRMAGEKERVSLGRPVTYEDGNEDSPLLCADTVDLGPEGSD